MYESLLEWCKFPVNVYVYKGFSTAGDVTYDEAVSKNGFPVDEMKLITDEEGKEYVSSVHVYFPAEANVTIDDKLSFPSDTKPREIKKLGGFSDGNTGKLDVIVAWL